MQVFDNPEYDCTDAAHPAWWRGYDFGFNVCCRAVEKILDGKDDGIGTCTEPWQSLRMRLIAMARKKKRRTHDRATMANQQEPC